MVDEYLSKYLFVWSEELWPPRGAEPSPADVRAEIIRQMRADLEVDHLPPGVIPVFAEGQMLCYESMDGVDSCVACLTQRAVRAYVRRAFSLSLMSYA